MFCHDLRHDFMEAEWQVFFHQGNKGYSTRGINMTKRPDAPLVSPNAPLQQTFSRL